MVVKEKRLITAALPYINNVPHLGHIVGSHLPADIFARYCRAKGHETLFIGGTDENGSASEIAASQVGVDLKVFSTKLYKEHKKIYDWFGISYDNFSRTTKKIHHDMVKDFFNKLDANGFVKERMSKVFYSPSEKRFLADRYIVGECPKCRYPDANGDQCEKCTSVLDSLELLNPRSKISGDKLEIKETNHLFLSLDKLSSKLKSWISSQKEWRPQVKNLALGWIKEGLRERGITRDLHHGVKIPLKNYSNKVFYVWFDAPIGYVSFTKEIREDWEEFWNGNGKVYNFLGKDNIPFHTIFWPAVILGSGKVNLPSKVVGLQFLNYEGKKFSKSKQVGVFCERLPQLELRPDVWRSYLTLIMPESNDSEFKWKDFQERTNADLIGNYGNYVNRIIKFVNVNFGGKLVKPSKSGITKTDSNLIKLISETRGRIESYLEGSELRKAYLEVLNLCSAGNKYINDTEPWNVIKEDSRRANDIYYNGALLLKAVSVFSAPFLPSVALEIWKQLGLDGSPLDSGTWNSVLEDFGKEHSFGKSKILFNKISNEDVKRYREEVSKGIDLKGFFR